MVVGIAGIGKTTLLEQLRQESGISSAFRRKQVKKSQVIKIYREFHLLANLGWVDLDLGCSTILLGQ